ncbi:phosphatase PAP2 family protein [Stenotrophomonas maltophilia]|uniref:Phosphatase PAP2 family protein n=3 Tax=Lysobacteraceae TaxID=32033 RepID=A0A4S2D7Y5_STEMA|nr:phosphatase PAP2 family protein [Stenotrophomonas maltophilia]
MTPDHSPAPAPMSSAFPASVPHPLAAAPAAVGFLRRHLWSPLLAALLVSAVLMGAGGDQWLADQFYRLEGQQWALQNAWVTSHLVHRGGKWASSLAALIAIVACFHAWRQPRLARWRWPLLYLVLAVALGTGAVSLLKSLTNMDCPWDLARYGGAREYIGLFASRPHDMARGICFPAGHSSAGFAWVALYFFALMVRPAWRWRGLSVGLVAGATFGLSQQLRGAHFLSHDLWTVTTCWMVSLGLYLGVQAIAARRQARGTLQLQGERA